MSVTLVGLLVVLTVAPPVVAVLGVTRIVNSSICHTSGPWHYLVLSWPPFTKQMAIYMKRVRDLLNIATNVLVIAIGAIVISVLIVRYTSPASVPKALRPGEIMPTLTVMHLSDKPHTFLLFVRKGCHFCEDSMPFYKELNKATHSPTSMTRLVALFPDNDTAAMTVLNTYGLTGMTFGGNVDFDHFGVSGTPTLVFVDRSARIVRTWVGELRASQEQDVLRLVSSAVSPTG